MKIVITGAAGLVGQNLCLLLNDSAEELELVAIDKNETNLSILKEIQPSIETCCADLAQAGSWMELFEGADCVVLLNAQIGAKTLEPFILNNVTATERILDAVDQHCPRARIVHISSSVVNSLAEDFYVQTKTEQENIVKERVKNLVVLRPTLMFGWFDRKHLGWLARFMAASPVFPIPGSGKYMRQPLYVRDFCRIIEKCVFNHDLTGTYEISGQERIDYIDVIRTIKKVTKANCLILKIPYTLFDWLLRLYAVFDSDPPFTVSQLEALVIPEEFEVIDWPSIFETKATPFSEAVDETFCHATYSNIAMEF